MSAPRGSAPHLNLITMSQWTLEIAGSLFQLSYIWMFESVRETSVCPSSMLNSHIPFQLQEQSMGSEWDNEKSRAYIKWATCGLAEKC